MLGTFALSSGYYDAYYGTAQKVRTVIKREHDALFERFDVLVLPSAQVWPFDIELDWPKSIADVVMDTYHRWMEVVVVASFGGLPALNVPVGFNSAGLPMGMQLIGPPLGDLGVLRLGHAYEQTLT